MTIVMISLISEQAMPNVMAPLLVEPRPDIVKCILPADPHDSGRKDSRFVGVYQGVQAALGELGFDKVRDRGPVPPYHFEQVKEACRKIREEHPGATFIYNVTGGTKLMAQAALADAAAARARGQTAWAVYVDTENARLVTLDAERVTSTPYALLPLQAIDVACYFQAYGVTTREGMAGPLPAPWREAACAAATAPGGPALMNSLARFLEPDWSAYHELTWDVARLPKPEREALEQLAAVTGGAGVRLGGDRLTWPLTKESRDFIWRRQWLEWYTFGCLQEVAAAHPAWRPPLRNVRLVWPGWDRLLSPQNELDAVTVRDGRLLICECKAGENAPKAEHIYHLQVVGYKAGTFADKVLVTATPHLTEPGKRQQEEQVIRALALDILLVGAETLPKLPLYLKDFDDWLYEQQTWFGLRSKQ
jgi:hypothetical protein